MSAINALIPRQRLFDGVPTSVPFTYRDGLTTLQLIECLRRNLDSLQCDLSKLEDATTDLAASVDKALADTVTQLNKDMASLRAELLALIHEMEQQGVDIAVINRIISDELEAKVRRLIKQTQKGKSQLDRQDLEKIVGPQIVGAVERMIQLAKKMTPEIDQSLFYCLATLRTIS